jgi:hypothetical protein
LRDNSLAAAELIDDVDIDNVDIDDVNIDNEDIDDVNIDDVDIIEDG